jgi:hypothetical protein
VPVTGDRGVPLLATAYSTQVARTGTPELDRRTLRSPL